MAINVRPGIVTNGLVLALDAANTKSYPRSGTAWRDLSGNNNSGSLVNGPTFSSANAGSIVFDGVDDVVNIQASSAYKPQFPLSVSVTFRLNSTSNTALIITDNPITEYHSGVHIFVGSTGYSISYGNNTVNNAPGRRTYVASTTVNTGSWYTVSVVLPDNLNCNVYVNGTFISSSYQSGGATTLVYAGSPGSIGYKYDGGARWFTNGNVSSAQIYNRALSASEVLQNYNATKARFGL